MSTTCILIAALAVQSGPTPSGGGNDVSLFNGTAKPSPLSSPSVGFPLGTFPPDFAGDWLWKVFPREILNHPNGTMEITGLQLELYQVNLAKSPDFWDLYFTRGKDSPTNPGSIEPDFSDPGAVFLSLGPSGFPTFCSFVPSCCDPLTGCNTCVCFCNGFVVDLWFPLGSGIVVPADGLQDLVVTAFPQGGMIWDTTCGDYSSMRSVSTNEVQADWLGTGYSAYSGVHLAGSPTLPDPVQYVPRLSLQFAEPTVAPYVAGDLDLAFQDAGIGGLRVPLSTTPGLELGVLHFAQQAAADGDGGANDFAFCAGTLVQPLAPPGLVLLGAHLLLDPADPLFAPTLSAWSGPYTNDGIFASNFLLASPTLPVPPGMTGLDVHCQCAWVDLLTFSALESNVATAHLH